MSLKRPRSPAEEEEQKKEEREDRDPSSQTWTSPRLDDRSSTFQGYFSPTLARETLQALPEISSASHRMLAYRVPSAQRTLIGAKRTLDSGADDDGERHGGRHILKVMEDMRVEGVCVVARWYGGVMLGPVRFAHIEECAGDAIRAWRQGGDSEGAKRRRVEDGEAQVARLAADLALRDESIRVLRRLLEQKTGRAPQTPETKPPPPPPPTVDYGALTLQRLRLLDKARDNTVAFLLKRIDEAERRVEAETDGAEKRVEAETTNGAERDGTAKGESTTGEKAEDPTKDPDSKGDEVPRPPSDPVAPDEQRTGHESLSLSEDRGSIPPGSQHSVGPNNPETQESALVEVEGEQPRDQRQRGNSTGTSLEKAADDTDTTAE